MVTQGEEFWIGRIRRTLAGQAPGSVLVWVAGAAGTGKSRLLRRLAELPEAAGAALSWRCGSPPPPPAAAPSGPDAATATETATGTGSATPASTPPFTPTAASTATSPGLAASPDAGTATGPGTGLAPATAPGPGTGLAPATGPGTATEPAPPALILVDDVHAAAPDTLARIRHLVEHARPHTALVLTYRPEDLPHAGLPLGTPPPRYPDDLMVLRHPLRPWSAAQVARAAGEALGTRCTPQAVARLHERSGGVAQVVTDLLAVLRERTQGRCTAADVDAAGVPVRLAELMLHRTHTLPEPARRVVWAAAVLDEPAPGADLLTVAGLPPGHTQPLTAALARAAVVEEAEHRYTLPVPLAAPAVLEAMPAPLRQDLHARAAALLQRRHPVPWAALARHHHAAGQVRAWLRAVERAAGQAAAEGRHQQAITLLENTLASPLVPRHARARLAPILAASAVLALRSDQTVEVLTQIVRDDELPPAVRGQVRLDLGLLLCNQVGMGPKGWAELERSAQELREQRPELAARAMSALAMPYWPGNSLQTHLAWMRAAEEASADSGDEVVQTAVAANRAGLALSYGNPEGWRLIEALPVDSPDPRCRRHVARGLCNAADSSMWLGFYDRTRELLAKGLELSARSGAPYTERTALGTRLLLQWATGQWEGLGERCEEFVRETADMPVISADARTVLGLLHLARGGWGPAASWLSGKDAPHAEHAAAPLGATLAGALIRLALARQDLPRAAAHARTAWAAVTAKGVFVWAAELAPWAVEALARAGDSTAARTLVDTYARGLQGLQAPSAEAALTWARAALAETTGDPAAAMTLYRRAGHAYAALPRPYARALVAEGAGRCALAATQAPGDDTTHDDTPYDTTHDDAHDTPHVDAHDSTHDDTRDDGPRGGAHAGHAGQGVSREQGLAELSFAAGQFSDLGAVWDAARVRALSRTHRPERRRPGRPSYRDQLSPREREVAELAGNGLTNREIATTLHLSPRTVEQHVARAMRKLGTASRQELAAAATLTGPTALTDSSGGTETAGQD
ncbi:LuxR C-terminal-related transcriptional regulator [Streptomyces sp. CC224B]|uniref:LuxR C-terminal-related transcriptional regulator n=1 Tax=Streptomyces sp. CC224B TaxID=3044571 RepID=UPI0024A82EBE|nr:LuxR C-terminal-related transcriptional regulator [Streptomyces sp. CC224B]